MNKYTDHIEGTKDVVIEDKQVGENDGLKKTHIKF